MASARGMFSARLGGYETLANFKLLFFDRQVVEDKAQKAAIKVQSRFGRYVRRRAQTSMKRRKKGVSEPGKPPLAKEGTMRRLLFYGYDSKTKSTVVGPVGIGKRPGEVPEIHEFGGTLPPGSLPLTIAFSRLTTSQRMRIIWHAQKSGQRFRKYLYANAHLYPELDQAADYARTYPARPFMRPALREELPKFAGLFRDTIK